MSKGLVGTTGQGSYGKCYLLGFWRSQSRVDTLRCNKDAAKAAKTVNF